MVFFLWRNSEKSDVELRAILICHYYSRFCRAIILFHSLLQPHLNCIGEDITYEGIFYKSVC